MIQKNLLVATVVLILSLIFSIGLERFPQMGVGIVSSAYTDHLPATGSTVPSRESVPLDRAPLQAKLVVAAIFLLVLLIASAPLFIEKPDIRSRHELK